MIIPIPATIHVELPDDTEDPDATAVDVIRQALAGATGIQLVYVSPNQLIVSQ